MKIIHKNQTNLFKNSSTCNAIEYPLEDKDVNGTIIELNGRFPEKGSAMNLLCKELAFVISGEGRIVAEGIEENFSKGDLILIKPQEKYFWEGKAVIFMVCTPPWYAGQYKNIN